MTFVKYILLIFFSLCLLVDVLLLMMAIATGHRIPPGSIATFLFVAAILFFLIVLTYRRIKKRT
jgi:hypothetical protein